MSAVTMFPPYNNPPGTTPEQSSCTLSKYLDYFNCYWDAYQRWVNQKITTEEFEAENKVCYADYGAAWDTCFESTEMAVEKFRGPPDNRL